MRKKVIAGNWKMNMLPDEAINYIQEFEGLVKDTENEVILCVPYTDLFYALLSAQNTNIKIGAQNMHWEEKGAFTGEVAPNMLKAIGVEYVIIGHSERRDNQKENSENLYNKAARLFEEDIKPIFCIGEHIEEKENGTTKDIIGKEILEVFDRLTKEQIEKIIIAYEPIWAIGTGLTPTVPEIEETTIYIKDLVKEKYNVDIKVLYGGSVNAKNVDELNTIDVVDGYLIGGASTKPDEFNYIIASNK